MPGFECRVSNAGFRILSSRAPKTGPARRAIHENPRAPAAAGAGLPARPGDNACEHARITPFQFVGAAVRGDGGCR
jgi:hypothetical protein